MTLKINFDAEWHDPRGPEPLPRRAGDGQPSIDLWREGYIKALDDAYEAAARAAGVPEHLIDSVLGRTSSQS